MKIGYFVILLFCAVLVEACSDRITEPQDSVSERGSIQFKIDKTSIPEDVLYVKAYLSRPNFDTLKTSLNIDTDSSASISFEDIAVGKWHLRVDALNAERKLIYTGEGDVEIKDNSIIQAYLELDPVSTGVGIITINITWENYKTLILQPSSANGKDAYVNYPLTSSNYSSKPYLLLFCGEPLEDGECQIQRVFMDFDFSSIPKNSLVLKAELSLYWGGSADDLPEWAKYHYGDNAFVIKRVITSWDQNLVSWAAQPEFSNEDSVYVGSSQTGTATYSDIDITNLVQRYVSNPENSKGFIFKFPDENASGGVIFNSSDYMNSYLRPTLVVKYR